MMGKVKAIVIATLAALVLNTSCYREISKQTYIGEVTSKEYHVWKTMGGYHPSFKFTIKTEEGTKQIDMTCPQTGEEYEKDIQDEIRPYGTQEFEANDDIKLGDILEVRVTELETAVFYSCPRIEYKKKINP